MAFCTPNAAGLAITSQPSQASNAIGIDASPILSGKAELDHIAITTAIVSEGFIVDIGAQVFRDFVRIAFIKKIGGGLQ